MLAQICSPLCAKLNRPLSVKKGAQDRNTKREGKAKWHQYQLFLSKKLTQNEEERIFWTIEEGRLDAKLREQEDGRVDGKGGED